MKNRKIIFQKFGKTVKKIKNRNQSNPNWLDLPAWLESLRN